MGTGPFESVGFSRFLWVLLSLVVVAVYAFHGQLITRLNVNWDEFYYLSFVHELERGALSRTWVTFHAHLFGWLVDGEGTELAQILAARRALFLLLGASSILLYRVAARFVRREAALFCVLCFLSFTFVLRSGASFRADPLAALLLLAALNLMLPPRSAIAAALAGAFLALSFLVTVKAALHVALTILILGVLVYFSPAERRTLLARAAVAASAFSFVVVTGLLWHRQYVVPAAGSEGSAFFQETLSKMLGTGVFFPRAAVFRQSVQQNLLIWLLLFVGCGLAVSRLRCAPTNVRARSVLMLCFACPLLSLAVYRNAFPYFYVSVLPLAVVACGLAFDAILDWRARSGRAAGGYLAVVIALTVFSGALAYFARHRTDETLVQRQLVDAVHRVFPKPVGYIDRCGMVASFEKVGFFMSSWGIETYRAKRQPIFRNLLKEHSVGFLVANAPSLRLDLPDALLKGSPHSLLAEDVDVLRSNFLHHWGLLFVQGKALTLPAGGAGTEFEILSGARYTLESSAPITIDGRSVAPGTSVDLASGTHVAAGAPGVSTVRLRWGENLYRPEISPVQRPVFLDF